MSIWYCGCAVLTVLTVHIGKTKCYLISDNMCCMVQYLMKTKFFLIGLMYMIWKSKDVLYILFGSFFQIFPDMRFYNLLHSRDFCVQLQTETLLTSTYSEWLNIMGCILGWSHIQAESQQQSNINWRYFIYGYRYQVLQLYCIVGVLDLKIL